MAEAFVVHIPFNGEDDGPALKFECEHAPGSEQANEELLSFVLKGTHGFRALEVIPEEYWNNAVVERLLSNQTINLGIVVMLPKAFITRERLMRAAMTVQGAYLVNRRLASVPVELRNEELALTLLDNFPNRTRRSLLLRGADDKLSPGFWEKAVTLAYKVLRHVPKKEQTWRMVVGALKTSLDVTGKEDREIVANLRPEFRCKALREALNIAQEDVLYIDWDKVDALSPLKSSVTA